MPFPHHDRAWVEAMRFLAEHVRPGESLIAPDEFVEQFSASHSYGVTFAPMAQSYPWAVIHKGMLSEIARDFLDELDGRPAAFANDVFVIFSSGENAPTVAGDSPHLIAFREQVSQLPRELRERSRAQTRTQWRRDVATMSVEEIRQEMNERYRHEDHDEHGGYEHPHLWDKVRFREVNRAFENLIGPVRGLKILELGCGIGRNVPMFTEAAEYLGTDLSDVAIEKSALRFAGEPHLKFQRMDAMQLDLPDAIFDLVVGVEMIEHVKDANRVLDESFRVLKPGGKFLVNSINRDSLHLRMARKMGYPEFRGTVEHVREFAFREMTEMLQRAGFQIAESKGIFLLPYYGIPEVDRPVRPLTDDDSEVVEWFRHLGEIAGADYGYEFVVSVLKPA